MKTRKIGRPLGSLIFERRLDILVYAAHATKSFTAKDIALFVVDAQLETVRNCISDLVDAGYVEKVVGGDIESSEFQATAKSRELFGGAA